MKYNFDVMTDRSKTHCTKWDVMAEQCGEGCLGMWVADMDLPVAQPIVDAIVERASSPIYGYTEKWPSVKQAIHDWYLRRYGYEFELSDMELITGVVYGISAAIRVFSSEGDGVIINTPAYKPFVDKTLANNRETVFSKFNYDETGRPHIDFADLESRINNRTKIFILCNPQNPTGCVLTHSELAEVASFCEKHSLRIIADEIHADFVFDRHFESILNISEYTKNNTVCLVAPSKTFNIAGLKIACMICKNSELREKLAAECGKVGCLSLNLFGLVGAEAAFSKGEDWFEQVLTYIDGNRRFAYEYITENIPSIGARLPEGTYFLWLDLTNCNLLGKTVVEFFKQDCNVFVTPGDFFGADYAADHARLNLACPRYVVEQALKNIKKALED